MKRSILAAAALGGAAMIALAPTASASNGTGNGIAFWTPGALKPGATIDINASCGMNSDGFALRERLRQNSTSQAIPFFFLSHLKDHEGIQRALALEVEHYLQKPYILPELIGLVLLKFRQKRALQF